MLSRNPDSVSERVGLNRGGVSMYKESYFDGGLFSYIGHAILAILITVLTLGICAP